MQRIYSKITMFLSLLIFWIILSGEINKRQIIIGVIASAVALAVSEAVLYRFRSSRVKIPSAYRIIWFSGLVGIEIFKAAYEHIIRVLTGAEEPKVIKVRLDIMDEFSIALISNAITLTPGTITVEILKNQLTVIGFAKDEEDIKKIKDTILNVYQKPFLHKRRKR